MKFESGFGLKVRTLLNEMHRVHEIVLTINTQNGHFRTYQEQASLNSVAGPGESFHNYGRAVDVLFNSIQFIRPDGTLMDGGSPALNNLESLNRMTWLAFWAARDAIAVPLGLHLIGTQDRPHLQSDRNKSAGRSLVALLNGHGTMRWDVRLGRPNVYKPDLGVRKIVEVGSVAEIWKGQARLSNMNVTDALGVSPNRIETAALSDLRRELQAELRWAEGNWKAWRPI